MPPATNRKIRAGVMSPNPITSLLFLGFFLLFPNTAAGQECGESLSKDFLTALKEAGASSDESVNLFAPSVYYSDSKTKYVTASVNQEQTLDNLWMCVDGASASTGPIKLYDDGTHGDDFANDGLYSRDCVHFCSSAVNFSDLYGFAMSDMFDGGSHLIVLDKAKRGTVPYDEVETPLITGSKSFASSHAFFFADVEGKYFPNYPLNLSPNHASYPTGKSVPMAALLQVFGDVFDFATVTNLQGRAKAMNGWGIYKWQHWDRRGGPLLDPDVGKIDPCAIALTGTPTSRLNGVITAAEVVSGDGFEGQLHELVHGVSGYSYHMNLEAALTGDNAHVPGTCTVDHSSLQGPIWDWVKGFPDPIERADGLGPHEGVRLEANQECNDCPDDELTTCCSFRFIDRPITKAAMVAAPELCTMSPLMAYIAGMVTPEQIPADKKTYYCLGAAEDSSRYEGCGTHEGQLPCITKVDESDRSRVTVNYLSRFTFMQLVNANGGKRFPVKKFNVVRHAAVHISSREPSEAEITFYTLLWRHHEVATEPWERINGRDGKGRKPVDNWQFHTGGHSILHSRLHGIDCGDDTSLRPPSCDSGNESVCAGAPCGRGAICKNLDGQPLCICKEGLVGDGIECEYPSGTGYTMAPAYETESKCFPENNIWRNFIDESSLAPYPGGKEPYAPTSCFGKGVCPVGWRCNRKKGCLPPSSTQICEGKGFNKGQCEALGCCQFQGGLCKKGSDFVCAKREDPNTAKAQCSDPDTCCYFSCKALELSDDGETMGQKGNCATGCTSSVTPDINGMRHWEVYLMKNGYYAYDAYHTYDDPDEPLKISGSDKNMYNRCKNQCFTQIKTSRFLLNIRKNGTLATKTCKWLEGRKYAKQKRVCMKKNISTQGYEHASIVCPDTCGAFSSDSTIFG